MQLAIVQNPHVKDPKHLWSILEEQERSTKPKGVVDVEFDATGFENLKAVMRQNPRIVVKS